jgi:chromosome segregation ATPase
MATIQDILKIEVSKIDNEKVRSFAEELIQDYKEMDDKEKAVEIIQGSVDRVYTLVSKYSPEALPSTLESPCDDVTEVKDKKGKNKKKTPKKDSATTKKKPTKSIKREKKKTSNTESKLEATKNELNELEEEVKVCRVKMKMYREEKRKIEGVKPQPTRYAKIKGHIISLGNLIPKGLKDDLEVQKEANRLLRSTHRSLLKLYKMTSVKGEKDSKELKERYEKIEEKLEK